MLSRWNMTERGSGNHGLLQVQYVFLELPKLAERKPDTGAEQWAWLFVHAPELDQVPGDLPRGPYRQALELANKATFTQEELDAYQKVIDEIQQVRELAEAKWAEGEAAGFTKGESAGFAKGESAGFAKGETAGKAAALLAILTARGLAVSPEARARIQACQDASTLERWLARALTAASTEEVLAGPAKHP
jgi:flagellar biosynthesis/type III secretory pathway protein FliH